MCLLTCSACAAHAMLLRLWLTVRQTHPHSCRLTACNRSGDGGGCCLTHSRCVCMCVRGSGSTDSSWRMHQFPRADRFVSSNLGYLVKFNASVVCSACAHCGSHRSNCVCLGPICLPVPDERMAGPLQLQMSAGGLLEQSARHAGK